MNTKIIKISTVVAYVVMVAVNYMAVLLPLGGRSTGEISENYPNLFAPAGYAFSIWGIIYILLGIYVVYQLWLVKNELAETVNRIFIVNALLNASWLFAWHYDLIWLSVIIMAGLLFTLMKISDILRTHVLVTKERWLVRLPFSIYFGWITVATIANVTVFLVYLGWNGFGISESFWTVIALLAGTFIGSWRMLRDRFVPYGLVLIWGYCAILAKHLSANGFGGQYPVIIGTVVICLSVFTGTIVFIIIKKKNN
ncbi:MAG: tryptophan-rich sensory protein [Endomicrobiaceae bacterium]|nr:tryptophan-rich sensory protein [Endomicrobiaceae bacterium]